MLARVLREKVLTSIETRNKITCDAKVSNDPQCDGHVVNAESIQEVLLSHPFTLLLSKFDRSCTHMNRHGPQLGLIVH